MGGILSYLTGDNDPNLDIPDSTTGLTPRECQTVQYTWSLVYQNSKPAGVQLFIELFRTHPEYQSMFPSFRGVALSQLEKSKKLEAHATNVMSSIATLVDNLGDVECLVELARKIGENHGRRKLKQQAFIDVKILLMRILKQNLGSKLTPLGEEAWSKTLDLANKFIFQGLQPNN
ncbi:hypothetical protein L9F63_016739 [Diploptera punctata]|uniref:Globin domain-containing protein n=1 Tax=Diploptera punctata TaxID=6984 RepID=A0AAD8A0C6_DIPPU|nr:hypothetical protein L9F63_016739 [Diploptera punctata]